jgi:hypothetical protein
VAAPKAIIRRHPLFLLVAVGVGIRVGLAFAFLGVNLDVVAFQAIGEFLERDALLVYQVNESWIGGDLFPALPYPPGHLPWIALADATADATGLPFHGVVQLAPILADVALAFTVRAYLGLRGAGERLKLAAFATVILGPTFIAVSGYQGQIDAFAILPAVLGLIAWERRRVSVRTVESGILVGLGAAIKLPAGLIVVALLPSARSLREAGWLVGCAVAVPVVMLIPFVAAWPGTLDWVLGYGGVPGRGGLSLVLDPTLGWDSIASAELRDPTGASGFVVQNGTVIMIVAVAALLAFLLRYRPAPIDAAVLLWLAVYATMPNFFLAYMLWGLPFFIMAGYVKQAAILQVATLPAVVIAFLASDGLGAAGAFVYMATALALWACWVVAFVALARETASRAQPHAGGVQEPMVQVT